MSAVGFIGPSDPSLNFVVRYGVVKVQPALWLPTIVDRMSAEVGSVLLVRSELSTPCAFLSGDLPSVAASASAENLAEIPASRRLLIPASSAEAPKWPTLVVTGLGPNLSESLSAIHRQAGPLGIELIAVVGEQKTPEAARELQRALPVGVQPKQILWVPVIDGLHQPWEEVDLEDGLDGPALTHGLVAATEAASSPSVDDLLRGDVAQTSSIRGPGVRISPPGHPASTSPPSGEQFSSPRRIDDPSPSVIPAKGACEFKFLEEGMEPSGWSIPGGQGQVMRQREGRWAVVLETAAADAVLRELKAIELVTQSGLLATLGLSSEPPELHVLLEPEALSAVPPAHGIRRWCVVQGIQHPIAD